MGLLIEDVNKDNEFHDCAAAFPPTEEIMFFKPDDMALSGIQECGMIEEESEEWTDMAAQATYGSREMSNLSSSGMDRRASMRDVEVGSEQLYDRMPSIPRTPASMPTYMPAATSTPSLSPRASLRLPTRTSMLSAS